LLKHQITIRTTHWDVTTPGYIEVELAAHSGKAASGEYMVSLNLTDIFTGWVETRAVMGKGQKGVLSAPGEMCAALPFEVKGLDSDNGGEFINAHLLLFCQQRQIQFTRGRHYKKDDNAHLEQKIGRAVRLLRCCDPFVLAKTIDRQVEANWDLANPRYSPGTWVG
jgi:hypothetical protein